MALSLSAHYLEFRFGTIIPQAWILLALTIVVGGILIGSNFSFFLVIIHGIVLLLLTCLQKNGILKYQTWDQSPMIGSILVAIFTLLIIAIVSWLYNREIEKALKRAKKSENDLKKERDNLEIEVEKRTKELKKVQLERMVNLYKFADFGRLTAGMFHDIVNPLTQVSLSLSNIELQTKNKISSELNKIDPVVRRAIKGTRQMEKLIVSVRKQVQQQETNCIYEPWVEIETVMENFEYKAKEMKIQVNIIGNKKICTFGNSLRFYQLVSNLISNAIDSYYEIKRKENRKINIKLDTNGSEVILIVEDFGCGIDEETKQKIFDPLFTTKDTKRGTGIGLYITKTIVEKEFGGKIEVESKLKKGTLFTIKFPIKMKPDEKKYK
ncbi:MAG: HAMP domain-containing sensor histidine kinase [Candidatus Shapirobacteria bacterium]|nr:HAMP domain-containing sensor histidine kinase [Candidatus Shapirobacteria bacterium]MDD4382940.1 HAMP domain-containing sensor histidine kinase [Candidatus Shapirobacteria bacterium]